MILADLLPDTLPSNRKTAGLDFPREHAAQAERVPAFPRNHHDPASIGRMIMPPGKAIAIAGMLNPVKKS